MIEARHGKTPFTGQTLRELQRAFDRDATARKGPLFVGERKPASAADYEKFATTHNGDANKGPRARRREVCDAHRATLPTDVENGFSRVKNANPAP